jgi:hypothetical protein
MLNEHECSEGRPSMRDALLRREHVGTVLTVLARGIGGGVLVVLMMLIVLDLFDDLIQKVVEKLVRILMHDAAKVFIAIAKLVDEGTWCNGTLIYWVLGNVHVQGAEGREEGGGH